MPVKRLRGNEVSQCQGMRATRMPRESWMEPSGTFRWKFRHVTNNREQRKCRNNEKRTLRSFDDEPRNQRDKRCTFSLVPLLHSEYNRKILYNTQKRTRASPQLLKRSRNDVRVAHTPRSHILRAALAHRVCRTRWDFTWSGIPVGS